MTVITVLIVSLMMTTLGMFLIVENALSVMIASMEEQVNLIVYLEDEAPPADVLALRQELLDDARTISVEYVTKEQALERLRESFKNDPEFLQPLLENPLPASLEVRSEEPDFLQTTASRLSDDPIVEEIVLPQDVVKNLIQISRVASFIGYSLGAGTCPRDPLRHRQYDPAHRLCAARGKSKCCGSWALPTTSFGGRFYWRVSFSG